MAIITISRGSYSRGKEVAEVLAKRLGYACVSRDILLETCEEFAIPEIRLVKALHDAPSILERFSHGKERFISYFRSAFLTHMAKDNIVFHGLSGHFMLQDISHACKVRIIANIEARVEEEMRRENCTAEEARYMLVKDDEERRRWGMALYGKDTSNCSLYDMVLHIDTMQVEDVVDVLEGVIRKGRFDATPESLAILRERTLLANIHAKVVNSSPHVTVTIEEGVLTLTNLDGGLKNDGEQRQKMATMLKETYGLNNVIFAKPVKSKKDHINTFYNLDIK
ncbi:MAG: cytidylate kinase-like family protein [Pseudomonadota bacterium]